MISPEAVNGGYLNSQLISDGTDLISGGPNDVAQSGSRCWKPRHGFFGFCVRYGLPMKFSRTRAAS